MDANVEDALRTAYDAAARAHAWSHRPNAEEAAAAADDADATTCVRDAEARLLDAVAATFASRGYDAAATLVDAARAFSRAQDFLPSWLLGSTSASSFATAWREACDRVELETIDIAHTQ